MSEWTQERIQKFWEKCGLYHRPEQVRGGHIVVMEEWSFGGRKEAANGSYAFIYFS